MRDFLLSAVAVARLFAWGLRQIAKLPFRRARRWFQRRIYFGAAPFRKVQGPYVLVLRSFTNRMAVGRRIRRIVRDSMGRPIDAIDLSLEPGLLAKRRGIEGLFGRPLDLGEPRPDLTLLSFLGEVRHRYAMTFVGVSNGSSLGGVLQLVHAPDDLWFEAMKALALHARAILVIPDKSSNLVREVAHVMNMHAPKVAFLMPPSETLEELRRDVHKVYQFEGLDLSDAWRDACVAMRAAGVVLPDYDPGGALLRCHPDGSLCGAKWPWTMSELNRLVEKLGKGSARDAHEARQSLKRAGLRLLRYPSPPGSTMDEAWYQRHFQEDFHVRDAGERQRLAPGHPWLGLHRADHVLDAPLPGARQLPSSPDVATRCDRCPTDDP